MRWPSPRRTSGRRARGRTSVRPIATAERARGPPRGGGYDSVLHRTSRPGRLTSRSREGCSDRPGTCNARARAPSDAHRGRTGAASTRRSGRRPAHRRWWSDRPSPRPYTRPPTCPGGSAPQDPSTPELLAPALGVPVPAVLGGTVRHDDEMPETRPDGMIAAGAAVLLGARDLAHLVARHDRPRRRSRPADGRGRREVLEGCTLVPPRHQLLAFTNSTTYGTSCAALSFGVSLRDRSNEWPASWNGT